MSRRKKAEVERLPPGARDVGPDGPEEVLLGAVLAGAILPSGLGVGPAEFYSEKNRKALDAALRVEGSGRKVDARSVASALGLKDDDPEALRLVALEAGGGVLGDVDGSRERVRANAARRAAWKLLASAQDLAGDEGLPLSDLAKAVQAAGAPLLDVMPPEAGDGEEEQALPPFPLDALPSSFREVVRNFAAGRMAEPELSALPALAVVSTALGPRWKVGPRPGWVSPPSLWLFVVSPSGGGKSPAADDVALPLEKADIRLREQFDHEQEQARAQGGKRGKDKDAVGRPSLLVTDATIEGLLAQLAANGPDRGLAWFSDEVVGLLGSFDRYSRSSGPSAARGIFLSLWSGGRVRSRRKGVGSVEVDHPFLVAFGGTQPCKLQGLTLENADGLLARFLCSVSTPPPPPKTGPCVGPGPSPWAVNAWRHAVEAALRAGPGDDQLFTRDGEASFSEFVRESKTTAYDLEAAGMGLAASIMAKAPEQAVRVAAALHGLLALEPAFHAGDLDAPRPARVEVATSTVEDAIRLMRYFTAHGLEVARRMTGRSPVDGDARNRQDDAVERALRGLVAAGPIEDTPGGWSKRLATVGLKLSPIQTGKRLARLRRLGCARLALEYDRDASRRWSVTRA